MMVSSKALAPIGVALLTTVVVTVLSYALPPAHQATGVGLAFLVVTYVMVLRHDGDAVARHGLALGGLLEPDPISLKRLLRDAVRAVLWALALALLIFPPFWLGWLCFWHPEGGFARASFRTLAADVPGQLLVIALPEEAFYRGYLQSALDEAFPARLRVLGAPLGASLLVTSALFALGHLATEVDPNRLAVFFPSLAFGWLRARTRGVGASIVFHMACNLFTAFLAASYGFSS